MLKQIIALKEQKKQIDEEIKALEEKFIAEQNALELLKDKEYGCGTATLEVEGYKVKVEVKKTVKWDNDKLAQKFKEIPDAEKYIKAEYKVSETDYKGWKQEIQQYFEDARTVVPSKPSLKIEEQE